MKTASTYFVSILLTAFLTLMGVGGGLILGFYASLFLFGSYSGWWLVLAPLGAIIGAFLGSWLGLLLSKKLFGQL